MSDDSSLGPRSPSLGARLSPILRVINEQGLVSYADIETISDQLHSSVEDSTFDGTADELEKIPKDMREHASKITPLGLTSRDSGASTSSLASEVEALLDDEAISEAAQTIHSTPSGRLQYSHIKKAARLKVEYLTDFMCAMTGVSKSNQLKNCIEVAHVIPRSAASYLVCYLALLFNLALTNLCFAVDAI
jgi:hypothetical protein